jgi:hypothetical protein
MVKYLSQDFVCKSFERLSSRNKTGKTHMERTSALMYFLSVDAAFKHLSVSILDLNPDSLDGKNNRKQVELEFTKLVLVGNSHGSIKQVIELGEIEDASTHPEKRISSNFLTVPLKRASDQTTPFYYPSRPKSPLFKMGHAATGQKWGVSFHENWKANFLVILTTIKGSTPLFDLAVFVCRDSEFNDGTADIFSALEAQLKKKFTQRLADFWIQRIAKEKAMPRDVEIAFSDRYAPFASAYKLASAPVKKYTQMTKLELITRIHQLESMLTTRNNSQD